ncbi:hypothetical protein D9601_10715 [Sphingomonas sp. MA1305]|nr:hypothetical protein [Sphingomonas sp. MA1305]
MFPHPTPQPVPQPAVPLIDNPFSPEIVANGVSGLSVINGIVTITLETVHCDHSKAEPQLERVVVGRVAASVPAAQALMTGLYQFLAQHGLNPFHDAGGATCQ